MDNKIANLKTEFAKIIDTNMRVKVMFEKLDNKIANLTEYYVDLIDKNKDKMYLFGLDSFRFQIALLDREQSETKVFYKVVQNRIYCEYYKFCKKLCEYIFENCPDSNLINIAKAINETELPAYDQVDPEKEYEFKYVLTNHDNICELLKCLYSYLLNKEHELKGHSMKRTMGLNIDNFVFTFNYNICVLRDKIKMFMEYMHFFHKMHLKNLVLIEKKLMLMMSEINNDLNLENPPDEPEYKPGKYKLSSDSTESDSGASENVCVIRPKREKPVTKKVVPQNNNTQEIKNFFTKRENINIEPKKSEPAPNSDTVKTTACEKKENEEMNNEDQFSKLVNRLSADVNRMISPENILIRIEEKNGTKKRKNKTKK
jgi:hypothetical protein